MKRKILSLLLAAALAVGLLPLSAYAADARTYGQLTYYVENDEVTIGRCENKDIESVEIPEEIEGYPVTAITDGAFSSCTALKDVTLPEGLKSIGLEAFYGCTALTEIDIPDSVEGLGAACFYGCTGLKTVHMPQSLKRMVLSTTFYGCTSLETIEIPTGVSTIAGQAFAGCTALKSVTISAGVTQIYGSAFQDCPALTICGYPGSTAERYAEAYGIPFTASVSEMPFDDVPEGEYYEVPVLWAYLHGITAGTSETAFSPMLNCTRGQMVTFLWRLAGEPEPETAECPFTDVPAGSYYETAICWAAEQGITQGVNEMTFAPEQTVTRAQVVTLLWRMEGEPMPESADTAFVDLTEDWYVTAVLWGSEAGVVQGVSPECFAPDESCTRGQIATFLYREQRIPGSAWVEIVT